MINTVDEYVFIGILLLNIRIGVPMIYIILLLCVSLFMNIETSGQTEQIGPDIIIDSGETELLPGRMLSYHLRIDQSVVNNRGVCVPAVYQLEVLDRDASGNIRIAVQVRTMLELLTSDTLFITNKGEMKIVGVRLAWATPKYEATLDQYGRVMKAGEALHFENTEPITMGALQSRTTDFEALSSLVMTFPTEYALLAPYTHGASMTVIGQQYIDTLLLRSVIQNIGQTYGPEKTVKADEKLDTVIRSVRVDSLSGHGQDQIAHMSVSMMRYPAYGTGSLATATMERYVNRGYMKTFQTWNNFITSKGLKIDYIATSVLERSWIKPPALTGTE